MCGNGPTPDLPKGAGAGTRERLGLSDSHFRSLRGWSWLAGMCQGLAHHRHEVELHAASPHDDFCVVGRPFFRVLCAQTVLASLRNCARSTALCPYVARFVAKVVHLTSTRLKKRPFARASRRRDVRRNNPQCCLHGRLVRQTDIRRAGPHSYGRAQVRGRRDQPENLQTSPRGRLSPVS